MYQRVCAFYTICSISLAYVMLILASSSVGTSSDCVFCSSPPANSTTALAPVPRTVQPRSLISLLAS